MGWVTVAAYGWVALSCFRMGRIPVNDWLGDRKAKRLKLFWWLLTALFAFLMVNKQLDLQTALTEVGRAVVRDNQLDDAEKRSLQMGFVGLFTLGALIGGVSLAFAVNGTWGVTWLTLVGTAVTLIFVVIRAASIHAIDGFIGDTVAGIRVNWMLELGGITITLMGLKLYWKAAKLAAITRAR